MFQMLLQLCNGEISAHAFCFFISHVIPAAQNHPLLLMLSSVRQTFNDTILVKHASFTEKISFSGPIFRVSAGKIL